MAADTKNIADRIWELGHEKSKVFNTEKVIYFFTQDKQDKDDSYFINLKYKQSDIGQTIHIPIDVNHFKLTEEEKKYITSLFDPKEALTEEKVDKIVKFLQGFQEKLKQYAANIEKKAAAIVLLEKYREERKAIAAEYKAPPCISDFFRDSFLPTILGIPRQDKLDAVDAIITWLEESKTAGSTLPLNLEPKQIKALTDKTLGEKIEAIRKLDKEFDSAFTAAIARSKVPSTGKNFSIN